MPQVLNVPGFWIFRDNNIIIFVTNVIILEF